MLEGPRLWTRPPRRRACTAGDVTVAGRADVTLVEVEFLCPDPVTAAFDGCALARAGFDEVIAAIAPAAVARWRCTARRSTRGLDVGYGAQRP